MSPSIYKPGCDATNRGFVMKLAGIREGQETYERCYYINGIKHGTYTEHHSTDHNIVLATGQYVNGRKHGLTTRKAYGRWTETEARYYHGLQFGIQKVVIKNAAFRQATSEERTKFIFASREPGMNAGYREQQVKIEDLPISIEHIETLHDFTKTDLFTLRMSGVVYEYHLAYIEEQLANPIDTDFIGNKLEN